MTEYWNNWTAEERIDALDEYDSIYSMLFKELTNTQVKNLNRILELERILAKLEDM